MTADAPHQRSATGYVLRQLGLALLYALTAKAALLFLAGNHSASLIWPPSGIAVAAFLIGGPRCWPGIFLGAVLGNLNTGSTWPLALPLAVANTLEAAVCQRIVVGLLGSVPSMGRPRDYLAILASGAASVCLCAGLAVTTLALSGRLAPAQLLPSFLHWCEGDFFGILLIVPIAMVWRVRPAGRLTLPRLLEAGSCFGLTVAAGQTAFLGAQGNTPLRAVAEAAVLIAVVWAALRFGRHGVTLVLCVTAMLGLLSVMNGMAPYSEAQEEKGLLLFWIYMAPLTFVGVITSLGIHERNAAEDALKSLSKELELRIEARTAALAESEQRFRTLVENAPEAIVVFDLTLRSMVDANPNACRLFGYTRNQLIGMHPVGLSPEHQPDGRSSEAAIREHLERVVAGESPSFDWTHRHASGAPVACEVRLVRLPSNDHVLIRGSIIDISKRNETEQELRSAISLLEATIESTADGILVVNEERRIARLNRRFLEMWRIPQDIVETREDARALEFILSQLGDPVAFIKRVDDLYSHPEAESFDLVEFKDGRVFERYSRPQKLGPRIIGRVWSFRDVSDRLNAERARQRVEAQLRQSQKLDAVGTLSSGIAHEFNNLLAGIMGNLELMRIKQGQNPEALDEIFAACGRAAVLVRQMLSFSQPRSEVRTLLQLGTVVSDSIKFVRASLPSSIEIEQQVNADCPTILADPAQIHQVLVNLCTNAWHAIGERRGTIRVSQDVVSLDLAAAQAIGSELREGLYVRLRVSDTGSGMSQELRERIFEPFFTTKAAGRGTGLGLSVVFGIIRAHHGAITASSEPGKGSTFHIYFPARQEAAPPASGGTSNQAVERGRGERVLVVDDEPAVAKVISRLLTQLGYHVTTFNSPEEALLAFRKEPKAFDLVISDITMPTLSGSELAARLSALQPGLPVILVTGNSGLVPADRIGESGIRELIQKPMTREALAAAVARALLRS